MNINDAELGKFMELAGETGIKVFLLHGDNWREAVATSGSLPGSGNTLGDIRQATDTGTLYRWNGASWDMYDNIANVLTTPTSTDTAVNSQGGLLINIDSATGDIARTTVGWIEDEKYGAYVVPSAATFSAEFDSALPMTGRLKAKLTVTVNAAGFPNITNTPSTAGSTWNIEEMYKYGIPVKPSTKYRFKSRIQGNTSGGTGVSVSYATFTTAGNRVTDYPNVYSGTIDQWSITEFTTGGTVAFLRYGFFFLAGTTGELNIDWNSITLEEVVEPVTNSITSPSSSIIGFIGQGSRDNIDQSLDTAVTYANTYTPQAAISEAATDKQTFIPTKSNISIIGIYINSKGTGNWTITVHDSGNVIQGVQTITNASITNSAWNYFTVPGNIIPGGTYHFHVTSTVADGTMKVNTASDLETCSFIQQYYKPSTSFTVNQNNVLLDIRSDADGFLNTGKFDIVNKTFSFLPTNDTTVLVSGSLYSWVHNLLRYTTTTTGGSSTILYKSGTDTALKGGVSGTVIAVFKIPMSVLLELQVGGNARYCKIEYSYDDQVYKTIIDNLATTSYIPFTQTIKNAGSHVFIKMTSGNAANSSLIGNATKQFEIYGKIDPSKIPTLYNYPTNTDIIQTYTKNLASATTIALYRATKYGYPAIEYSNGEYQLLDVDTTASGSTIAFSANGSSYTTVADGASIALTSTLIPVVWVKVNITANRIYISSNDNNADITKDGSMKMGIVYQVKNQGLAYDVQDLQKEVNELKTPYVPGMTNITGDIIDEAGSYLIVPTVTGNINLLKVPKAGTKFTIIVRTSGTTSYTLTFNTGFKSTGTLATGTVDSKYFTVNFISDGIQAIETSRTTAM